MAVADPLASDETHVEPALSDSHRAMLLEASKIALDVVIERGYRTVAQRTELRGLGFPDYQARPGLLVPIHGVTGGIVGYQIRPDQPRQAKNGKPVKYETRDASKMAVDVHPRTREQLGNPAKAIWITEGVKKGDAIVTAGGAAIALIGVHNFRGTNAQGGKTVLPDFEFVAWQGRLVYIAFDSDHATNFGVCDAMARLAKIIGLWGGIVRYVAIPSFDGSKVGIDDYLASGGTLATLVASHCSDVPPLRPPKPTNDQALGDNPPKVYLLTELGNAERLVDRFGENLRYCATMRRWLVWDGRRWKIDETDDAPVYQLAQSVIREMYVEAQSLKDDGDRKALIAWALRSENRRPLQHMIDLARTLSGIPITIDQLDQGVELLNLANGTLDLRTFEMRPHRREDLLTRVIDIPYEPSVDCPRWVSFLDVVLQGDQPLMRYIWKACGYSLTGETNEKCFFFLYGHKGDNGKSVFVDTLMSILGAYASNTPTSMLIAKIGDGGVPNDVARLRGARFVAAAEMGDGKRLDEELIKQLTGDRDMISARYMRGEWFDFRPSFKLWITGNYKPIIRGQDQAIWNRPKLIPFLYSVPKEDQDRGLHKKLWDERSGILAWMIEGCMTWRKEGLGSVESITKAVSDYREEMDDLGEFLEQCTVLGSGSSCRAGKLYEVFEQWCKVNGMKVMTSTSFGRKLATRGFEKQKTRTGAFYLGLALLPDESLQYVYRGGE